MRQLGSKTYVFIVSAVALVMPQLASAAPFVGPLVPQTGACSCPGTAPGWGCVLQTVQTFMNFIVYAGVLVCVLFIAYGGFSLIVSGGNPEGLSTAKTRITNAIIGIVVTLCAWLMVDFVMKVLYNPDTVFEGQNFGPWNALIVSNGIDLCIRESTPDLLVTGAPLGIKLVGVTNTGGSLTVGGGGACSAANVQQGAQAGGYQLTSTQANRLACIARFESNCGVKNLNYKWNRGSSAAGAFQVLLDGNSECYENNACRAAAGVSGNLNCSTGFRGGNPYPPGNQIAERCVKAAANLACSSAAAACVLKKQGYGAWLTDPNSAKQRTCTI